MFSSFAIDSSEATARYVRSFINIKDEKVQSKVEQELAAGVLWPEPLIQINPSFEPGESIDTLVDHGILHPECRRVFRVKSDPTDAGRPLNPHKHQVDAIRAARRGGSYVLTTGTGLARASPTSSRSSTTFSVSDPAREPRRSSSIR